jgi:GDP-L-fucose synthase
MPASPGLHYSLRGKRVWVAGHRGMVGGALVRRLAAEDCELLTVDREKLDLRRQADVEAWMERHRPQAIFLAAATVGGVLANDTKPAEFLYDNIAIETNVIRAAHLGGVEKLLFLGSACIYPRLAAQPIVEEALLTGPLEPTNEWYAVAKIAGVTMCRAFRRQYGCHFISAMPNNLYGPGDNFDLVTSHVLPALLRKIHEAKVSARHEIPIWGNGTALREFLYVDDLADALVFLIQRYDEELHVNIGTGEEISILGLAEAIAEVVGWRGGFVFERDKPDGMPRKLVDASRLAALGWTASVSLREGLERTYAWYLAQQGATETPRGVVTAAT